MFHFSVHCFLETFFVVIDILVSDSSDARKIQVKKLQVKLINHNYIYSLCADCLYELVLRS